MRGTKAWTAGCEVRHNPRMNRVTALLRTPAVAVERFDHAPDVAHRDPEGERAATHAVSFVEAGSFRLQVAGAWHELTPSHLFVATPGLEFACAHDEEHPADRCLSIRFDEQAVESLRSAGAAPLATPVVALDNRRAFLRLGLGAEVDAARVEALAGALYWSLAGPAAGRPLFRPGQLAWYAARVERARTMMQVHYAEPLSLSQLAREAGMSVYHFARVFSELQGQSPHQFLVEVRLNAAAERLRAGASVTQTCYAVGFGSLSHFVTSFRRRFGVRPSQLPPRPCRRA